MTRKMTQAKLAPAAKVIIAEISRCLTIGQWGHISHRTLARRLGLSESTVSKYMPVLAGEAVDEHGRLINPTPFILRRRRVDGKGFEICPLPPPELRPKVLKPRLPVEGPAAAQMAFFVPQNDDPAPTIIAERIPTPQNEVHEGSPDDQSILLTHACSSSSMGVGSEKPEPDNASEQGDDASCTPPTHKALAPAPVSVPIPLPPVMPPGLRQLGLLDHQWAPLRRVVDEHPVYGLAELVRDLKLLRERTDPIKSPFALVTTALRDGVPIYSRAEYEAQQAELAALLGRVLPPKEAPNGPAPTPAAAPARAAERSRRPVDAPPERAARPGRGRAAEPAQPPAPTRDEWEAVPANAAATWGLSVPRGRYGLGGAGGGGGLTADRSGPLRE